jgi:hypothetical protein
MLTSLWWLLVPIGLVVLSLFVQHFFRLLRLHAIAAEFLSLQDMKMALEYARRHPPLLARDAEELMGETLNRAWARGHASVFVSGVLHTQLLDECRKQSGEAACQAWADMLQGWLDTMRSPGWQRALKVLGEMAVKQEASVPLEEVDQELVDSLDQVITFLSPFATQRTLVCGSVILDGLRQILQQKANGTLLDPPPADARVSATRHVFRK